MNVSGKRRCPKWICLIGVCTALLLLLCACDKPEPLPVEGDFSRFTEEETAFLEKVFDRDISMIEQNHLNTLYTLNIVGDMLLRTDVTFIDIWEEGYMYEEELIPYDMDCAPDLSLLRLFPNLKKLGIYFCPALTDVSALTALPRLESLTMYMTSVTDFSVLSAMTNLSDVCLRGNPVKKLEFAKKNQMTRLQVFNGFLTDLSFLEYCPDLQTLIVAYNRTPLQNTERIADLTGLFYLNIAAPDTDFSFLKNMTAPVKVLGLGSSPNIDLNMSESLRQSVVHLSIRSCSGMDLSPLEAFRGLSDLLLAATDYTDPTGIAQKLTRFIESEESWDIFLFWNPEV